MVTPSNVRYALKQVLPTSDIDYLYDNFEEFPKVLMDKTRVELVKSGDWAKQTVTNLQFKINLAEYAENVTNQGMI